MGGSWQAVSSSYDDAENTKRLSGYGLLGLRSSWALTRGVLLSVKVDNVLDKTYARARYSYDEPNYENNRDYREEGRVWMFGVTWTPEI